MKLGRYLVGLISGLTFGMLFAPKQGKKLRDELVKKGGESGHEALTVLYKAFKDAGTDAVGEMKKLSDSEQLQSALSMSKDKMREYLKQIEDTGYDLAAQAEEGIDDFTNMAEAATTKLKKQVSKKKKVVKRAVKSRVKAVKKTVAKKVAPKRKVTTRKKATPKKK